VVVVLMGVAGSGKTTIGTRLAAELGWPFADGDDYHPAANVEKMRNGIALTDEDRAPWLATLRGLITNWISQGMNAILACSALRQAYRDELRVSSQVQFVFLHASRHVLQERLHARAGHYMKENMLNSQLATLEVPHDALAVDVSGSLDESVRELRAQLNLTPFSPAR